MTAPGRIRRLNSGSGGVVDAARCPTCSHPARIHNPAGCVFGPCECVVTLAQLMPDAPRLEVPDGIESTPAVKAPAPADSGGGHAAEGRPVKAEAPVVPVRPLPAWDPPKLPGAGVPRTPLNFEPFLAAALYVSARWYCPACHQWPLDPGACQVCRKPLQAVYHVTIPRELP